MLVLGPLAEIHLGRESRRLTICGVVYKNDGTTIRCTQHDEDIEIDTGDVAGTYYSAVPVTGSDLKSAADLSADNMEIAGHMTDSLAFSGFTAADVEAGEFDSAPFETFLCQWDDANAWQKTLRRGYLGEIKRTAEGAFQAEWRGLLQVLAQTIGRTYSETCDVERFGDTRCGLDITPFIVAGTVAAVTSRRRFDVTFDAPVLQAAGYFDLGELLFIDGLNINRRKQVKRDSVAGTLGQFELWENLPKDVQVGDRVNARPACDRRFETCQFWNNTVNFRGHGRWMPGIPNIIRAP